MKDVKVCPKCKQLWPMSANFCGHCGTKLKVKER